MWVAPYSGFANGRSNSSNDRYPDKHGLPEKKSNRNTSSYSIPLHSSIVNTTLPSPSFAWSMCCNFWSRTITICLCFLVFVCSPGSCLGEPLAISLGPAVLPGSCAGSRSGLRGRLASSRSPAISDPTVTVSMLSRSTTPEGRELTEYHRLGAQILSNLWRQFIDHIRKPLRNAVSTQGREESN